MINKQRIAIVGGGITGLSAAYYLQKEIEKHDLPYEIKLIEASPDFGGKIKTVRRDGFIIERGPDSFLERKRPTIKLIEALGMEDQLVRNGTGQSYVLVKNKLHKIPPGSFMGIPVQMEPFVFSSLFSLRGKLRGAMDLVLPKGKPVADQSLGHFFRRRFGNEIVDNLIEPLLGGIYSGNMDDMSLMATFPNFYALEQKYGSLIKGLKATMPKPTKSKSKKPGAFLAFRNGFESLVEELVQQINPDTLLANTKVDHIEKKDTGYHLLLSNGEVYMADAIMMTTPHFVLPKVLSQYDFFNVFNDIPVTSVANVALAFDASAIKQDIDGTGYVISRKSGTRITACTWTNKKWPTTTPPGKVLLRSYVGKPDDQGIVDLSDEEITAIVLKDLGRTMKITKDPEFTVITRWKHARPQYTVGHLDRLTEVRRQIGEQLPGLFLAGSSYEGVGIPDCIQQGEDAVGQILEFLAK